MTKTWIVIACLAVAGCSDVTSTEQKNDAVVHTDLGTTDAALDVSQDTVEDSQIGDLGGNADTSLDDGAQVDDAGDLTGEVDDGDTGLPDIGVTDTSDDALTEADVSVPADAGSDTDAATCPDACAGVFGEIPTCQMPVWDTATCTCKLEPTPDGSLCEDGDSCSLGDACMGGVCQAGPETPSPESCQLGTTSILQMPNGGVTFDFDTCVGCDCCGDGGTWPGSLGNKCVGCSVEKKLGQYGITMVGGSGSSMVGCITGNDDAPMSDQVIFVGGANQVEPGVYALEFNLPPGVKSFGFTAVPSSSDSTPEITLEGFDPNGVLVGTDSFDFAGFQGGGCPNTNPAVQFFGFRACCGTMSKVIAKFTNANVTIDHLTMFPLQPAP